MIHIGFKLSRLLLADLCFVDFFPVMDQSPRQDITLQMYLEFMLIR